MAKLDLLKKISVLYFDFVCIKNYPEVSFKYIKHPSLYNLKKKNSLALIHFFSHSFTSFPRKLRLSLISRYTRCIFVEILLIFIF